MSAKTATLIGATGLIGSELLPLLLNDETFSTVKILVRRPFEMSHPKLEKKLVDFNDADSILVALDNSDVIFCTVGTTNKKVKGDKAAYRKVDYDIPVNAAKFCKMTKCETFVLVSAVGANSKSGNFYLRLKGEVEDEVNALDIKSTHIMRPSILMGDRKESRAGESIGIFLTRILSFAIPAKYKAVKAKTVAKVMLQAAKENNPGFHIYEGKNLFK